MAFALRHDTIRFFVEKVLNGEVGEFQAKAADKTRGTPTEREFDLVGGLGFELVGDIDGSLLGVRLDIRHEFFLVEVPHLRQLTQRTHDVRLRVELTWLGIELTANDMLIDARVARDVDLIDSCGLALVHTHLEVDTVVLDIDFDRLHIEKQIAAIGIQLRDGIIIALQTLVEHLEIVGVALFDTQRGIEQLVGIDRVADPVDIAHVVFLALADGHIDIDTSGVVGVRNDAVRHDVGIAVTDFVILFDDGKLVLLVLFGDEFFGSEEVDDIVIIRLLHRLVDLRVGQRLVAGDINLAHFCFGLLIHVDGYLDIARVVLIVELQHLHLGIVESLLG